MCLISIAVFDTIENQRSEYTEKTLYSLMETVNLKKHRVIVVDNDSCEKTKTILAKFLLKAWNENDQVQIITLPKNLGTARGINQAWKFRKPGENAVKMDNDVIINCQNWPDIMEEAIARDPRLGIVAFKRKDLEEYPGNPNEWYNTSMYFLPHERGESWIPFEESAMVMGTCQMYSSALLDKIGYLCQPGIYGFDDTLSVLRSRLAGFRNGFLPHVNIDHIDTGANAYTQEKQRIAGEVMPEFQKMCEDFANRTLPLYWEDKE